MPNYQLIYSDLIDAKYPDKRVQCEKILNKKKFTILDVIKINQILVGAQDKVSEIFNQQHRSYDYETIVRILKYQNDKNLTNVHIAREFKMSRNTITIWKKRYREVFL